MVEGVNGARFPQKMWIERTIRLCISPQSPTKWANEPKSASARASSCRCHNSAGPAIEPPSKPRSHPPLSSQGLGSHNPRVGRKHCARRRPVGSRCRFQCLPKAARPTISHPALVSDGRRRRRRRLRGGAELYGLLITTKTGRKLVGLGIG